MINFIQDWYRRNFADPQAMLLAVFMAVTFSVILVMGDMLAPFLAAIIIAYLLEGPVQYLQKASGSRSIAVVVVFLLFMAVLLFLVLGLIPLLYRQVAEFFQELPNLINDGRTTLLTLPESYPAFVSVEHVEELMTMMRRSIAAFGENVLSVSLASIPTLITALVYLIVGPLLLFFFLKDKALILGWARDFLPHDRRLLLKVWREMDDQIGNYVRGKINEILIVGVVTYVIFALMGLSYAALLAVLVGVSVIIPYIGAVAVTFPVAFAGYGQWGWGPDFAWFMVAYAVIQGLDGNLLVPLLFSEAVNLHPVAIILAVLVFGGFWGFWGVFFAIPLATLVKALLNAWPKTPGEAPVQLPEMRQQAR